MAAHKRQRYFVPEVVQTSAMDCGPASLKCLLEGYGIPVSYGRLREACQTDVDGTSIDVMEEVAKQLGLPAEQVVIPRDHVLLNDAACFPALAVVERPGGLTHFVVLWRRLGNMVQVMDPATGRRWVRTRAFLNELYEHGMAVSASGWREWAASKENIGCLTERLRALGANKHTSTQAIAEACRDPGWQALAALDAAVRMVQALIDVGALSPSAETVRVALAAFDKARDNTPQARSSIPLEYWSARVLPAPDDVDADETDNADATDLELEAVAETAEPEDERLWLSGVVLVRIRREAHGVASETEAPAPLSRELAAALEEKPATPFRDLVRALMSDGVFAPSIIVAATLVTVVALVFEAMLLRGLFDIGIELGLSEQRGLWIGVMVVFALALILKEVSLYLALLRLGRKLETRIRIAFLEKIPKLGDRYFQSRLSSDMADRSHNIHALRALPALGMGVVQSLCMLLFTVVGIVIIDPASLPIALAAAAGSILIPLAVQPMLAERDLRVRTHAGALSRYYLDSLLGLMPIRAHGAERAIRNEHEHLLTEWARAGYRLQGLAVWVEGVEMLLGTALAAWLLIDHLDRSGAAGATILLIYWALALPAQGQALVAAIRQYPAFRNVVLRVFEPLGAPEDDEAPMEQPQQPAPRPVPPIMRGSLVRAGAATPSGMAISMRGVSVVISGATILSDLELELGAGEHVAVVGASGAGKTSLVGLLLGWHRPSEGTLLVDGVALSGAHLDEVRRRSAWVDPAVQLWNRTLLDNLQYGAHGDLEASLPQVLDTAELRGLLDTLPQGLMTRLGEGGALVSGGEGQRVRLGRAMLRSDVGLAILDEPFRGLDREQRRNLLMRARDLWRSATLICVTHDVGETRHFDRVVVIAAGKVVEDGHPSDLLSGDSAYRSLFEAEQEVQSGIWRAEGWRHLRMEAGKPVSEPGRPAPEVAS